MDAQPIVLVAEDEKKIRQLLKKYLEKDNFKVILAENGAEAVQKAELQKFDLIITDIKMPRIGGDEAIQMFKIVGNVNRMTPIFVISGHLTEELILDKLKGNIVKAYVKPFRFKELVDDAISVIFSDRIS